MKNNPDLPGGSLKNKPTWSNTSGSSATSAFLFFGAAEKLQRPRGKPWIISKGRLIMYIGGGLVTLVVIVVLVMFVLRR